MAKNLLKKTLEKAGISTDKQKVAKRIFYLVVIINILISVYLIYIFISRGNISATYAIFIIILIWLLIFFLVLFTLWILFYFILDLRIFKHRLSIEEALPDYLQLTAANIRAGMPPDHALWYAARPRFGALSKEMETVAKETMTGESLPNALRKFANKYDSQLLHRSINLLIEGMEAGGEIGNILNKVATNIQEKRALEKEMSANVTTYVIFISAAVIFAAPALLALSNQLLIVLSNIISSINIPSTTSAGFFSLNNVAISPADFKKFSIITMTISSLFSAMIVATIKKGTVKEGLKYIPLFIGLSLLVFWLSSRILSSVLGGFF